MGILSKELEKRGYKRPIIVGGLALELYTQGSYTTGDIDIKAPKKPLEEILKSWGFSKNGRVWVNEELDLYIDWLGSSLEEGKEAEQRLNTIIVSKDLEIDVISVEDLIIDRLNAVKWWNDKDGLVWVKLLLKVKKMLNERLDIDYLNKRAKEEDILDLLEKVLTEQK